MTQGSPSAPPGLCTAHRAFTPLGGHLKTGHRSTLQTRPPHMWRARRIEIYRRVSLVRLPLTLTTASRAVAILPALSCVSMSAMTACGAGGRRVRRPKRCGKRPPPPPPPPAAARPARATAFSISLAGSRGPREPTDRRGCRRSAARALARPVLPPLPSHWPGWYGSVAGPSLVCAGRRSCGGATVLSARGGARRAARGRWSRRCGWGPPSRMGSHVRVQFGTPAARSTLEHVRVVEEAVEERGHRRGVAEELPPVVHGSV